MRLIISVFLYLFCNHRTLPASAQLHECAIEKNGPDGEEHCVFKNVQFSPNTAEITFNAPPEVAKPTHITFKNSSMIAIPREFLEQFGGDLKVLSVENCNLRSVTITSNMVALYARNNFIDKVIVHQSEQTSVLTKLDLSMNRLNDIRNITRCRKLQVLNLSTNEYIAPESTLDLSMFTNFQELQELYLADVGALYLDNTKNIGLKSLTLLDLSKNSLVPSDLRIEKLYPFASLNTLKLNDNDMNQLDYALLLQIKSLKTVYLSGNNFMCSYLKTMIDFLKENGVSTQSERRDPCQPNQQEIDGICCNSRDKPFIKPRPSTSPVTPPSSESDQFTTHTSTKAVDDGAGGFNWGIFGIVVVVLLVVIIAVIGFFVYKKRSHS